MLTEPSPGLAHPQLGRMMFQIVKLQVIYRLISFLTLNRSLFLVKRNAIIVALRAQFAPSNRQFVFVICTTVGTPRERGLFAGCWRTLTTTTFRPTTGQGHRIHRTRPCPRTEPTPPAGLPVQVVHGHWTACRSMLLACNLY